MKIDTMQEAIDVLDRADLDVRVVWGKCEGVSWFLTENEEIMRICEALYQLSHDLNNLACDLKDDTTRAALDRSN